MSTKYRFAKKIFTYFFCSSFFGSLVARVFNNKLKYGWTDVVVDTSGKYIKAKTKAQIFWGIYESAERRFVTQYLTDEYDVLELGSSLGVISSLIMEQLKGNKRLFCVEANPDLIEKIRVNLSENTSNKNYTISNLAVSTNNERTSFARGASTLAGRLSSLSLTTESETFSLQASTLGEICTLHGLGDYVLVSDIEGAEAFFINTPPGVSGLDSCKLLIIELHNTPTHTVTQLRNTLVNDHVFRELNTHGNVFVFKKD